MNDPKRRAADSLPIIDDSEGITREELKHLKEIAHYWSAGRIVVAIMIGLGATALAAVHLWDFIARVITQKGT